jgi:hypothetical protein
MKQRKYFLLFLKGIILSSCIACNNNANVNKQNTGEAQDSQEMLQEELNKKSLAPETDTVSFEIAFNRFFEALQAADTAQLNQYIHPEYGIWIIEQPGAMPKMTRITDIRLFKREYQNRSFFTVAREVTACELLKEPFPEFDCADLDEKHTGYMKDGCFEWEPGKFIKSGYWNYASLSGKQIDQVKSMLPLVQRSVLHTQTSFEFHFGYVGKHWRLLFTKLIYPCSA